MNKTASEARQLAADLKKIHKKWDNLDVVICPPFTALSACQEELASSAEIYLGAQNMHFEATGAYTGEISAPMLKDLWVKYVILGHSERREYFKEDDALVNRKAKAALSANLRPIVCVGETLAQRESGQMEKVVVSQTKGSLNGFADNQWDQVVVAYEPVWAIGTGKTATPDQAQEVHALIRKTIATFAGDRIAAKLPIQYGGSVKPDNAKALMGQPDIDGFLVGGASLSAESFFQLIENACQA
ncbi:MAG: triose-phosphate isomerase [Bdellovibrionaceae bacterium]|nr:triose-phosphate isomerase [Pseudobdellovibrionaceae bacterium]